ncbi:MAG: acyl-CoA/acyl-ACP dehydrogenase [Halieaceae bacterium]|nr:acyl-CoA/acyl-ACP dehydrogenase [Halieaceae bacterium]
MISDEDRNALRNSLSRLLEAAADEAKLRSGMEASRGYDSAIWQQLAEMGLLGITVNAGSGGIGGGAIDIAMVAEEIGRSLLPIPFIEAAVIAAALLEASEARDETNDFLARIIDGTATVAVGGKAGFVPYSDQANSLTIDPDGKLSGEVSLVLHGATADYLLLAFDEGADTRVVFVKQGSDYVVEALQANDPALRPAKIRLGNAECIELTGLSVEAVELARLRGVAALAAQQVGAARAIFDITIEYLNTRYQFGRPIGSFQALKHMAADLLVEVESATSAARAAALALDAGGPNVARTVALAGFVCADAFREVSAQAIQMHGGIAYTREHVAHLYWRRARAMLSMFGDSNSHREAYLQAWEKSA